jgi:GTP-binding protein HflX
VICHVRDISHPETEEQAKDVRDILTSLGVEEDRPGFEVWNKLDLLPEDAAEAMRARAERDPNVFAISALTGEGIDTLLAAVTHQLQGAKREVELVLGFADGKKRAWLFEQDLVESERQTEAGFELTVRWTPEQQAQFERL